MLLAGAAAAVILLTVPPKWTDNFRQKGVVLQGGNGLTMMLLRDENTKTATLCTLGCWTFVGQGLVQIK